MGISVQDLKDEIKDYNYEVLTGGDDTVAQRCIDKAEVWAKAKLIQAKAVYDEADEILRGRSSRQERGCHGASEGPLWQCGGRNRLYGRKRHGPEPSGNRSGEEWI